MKDQNMFYHKDYYEMNTQGIYVNILQILGLDICADTMVGNEMLGSISGGQRKRVTTGEMLVGPTNALFVDEISTVLDSSTTFQIVRSLRQYVPVSYTHLTLPTTPYV